MDTLFFIISKILWAFVVPETLLVLLFLLSFILVIRRRQKAAAILLGVGVALATLIAIFPLGNALLVPLESRYPAGPPLRNVAGIIILGGGTDAGATEYWGQPALNQAADRFFAGIDLARRFPDAHIYFSGGSGRLVTEKLSEAVIARQILVAGGVDPGRLMVEGESRSTAENARLLRKLVPRQAAGQWLLVTSAFHMPRAMLSFCAAGWTGLTAYPVDYRTSRVSRDITWNFAEHLENINVGAKEWMGLIAYRLTGRSLGSCSLRS